MQARQSTNAASCADFRLKEWLIEPASLRLSAGTGVIHLRPLAMELLVLLARNAGRVVSQDEIRTAVWGRRFLAESALTRLVADLRQALRDDTRCPRFLETVSKRGYRLIGPVEWGGPAARKSASRLSIVVLPLVDMAPDRDQEYFCDGMAEELTHALTRLDALRVIARTSAFSFKGRGVDVREIGRQLNVDLIVEGSVQRSGDRLRITVQLVEAASGGHLWSERFDHVAGDLFAIEDEIARALVKTLEARLAPKEESTLPRRHSRDPEAHDLYLRGRHLWGKRTADSVALAIRSLECAIARDPEYAAAHAALSECYGTCAFLGFLPPREAFPRARQAAESAIALDPGSAEACGVLGLVSGAYEWDWPAAERWFERALAAGPSCAQLRIWHSDVLVTTGRLNQAHAQLLAGFDLDPLSPVMQSNLAYTLALLRDYPAAIDRCRKGLELHPDHALVNLHLGRAYYAMGDYQRAVEPLRKAGPGLTVAMSLLGAALVESGRRAEAEETLREMKAMTGERYVGPFAFVMITAALEGDERGLDLLARAFDEHEGLAPTFLNDPLADRFRGYPRFHAMAARLGLP